MTMSDPPDSDTHIHINTSLAHCPPHPLAQKSHSRHSSKVSIATSRHSTRSHKDYIDSLPLPSPEQMEEIGKAQEKKEEEVMLKRAHLDSPPAASHPSVSQARENQHTNGNGNGNGEMSGEERRRAAKVIQRNYRGHRERRMLEGLSLDPATRWVEAVKEARYRQLTEPRRLGAVDGEEGEKSRARAKWRKIGIIARRAGGDEDSDSSGSDSEADDEEREARRKKRLEAKLQRRKKAKMMDLQYFLEMVDIKHRYGSNLRTYHEEWKRASTQENFFYWLDYGEGRYVETAGCPRERLEKERVRYLSKEERLDYLVTIDAAGRLCWAKTGIRIDTTEKYKDSIHGIVPVTSDTPAYAPMSNETLPSSPTSSTPTSSSSSPSNHSAKEEASSAPYATPALDQTTPIKKIKHVSAATIFNKLLRSSVQKNTWIFVADTNFRLYVGIKQSGAFQHSSFLHGSRISAAGLIKVKSGRLSKLSPLSGHYRPPVANFRAFVQALRGEGVDMGHVSISRSYAVLVGLEAYVKTRRRGKRFVRGLVKGRDRILDHEEVRRREEGERDGSQSAAVERRVVQDQRREPRLGILERLGGRLMGPRRGDEEMEKGGEENKKVDGVGVGKDGVMATS